MQNKSNESASSSNTTNNGTVEASQPQQTHNPIHEAAQRLDQYFNEAFSLDNDNVTPGVIHADALNNEVRKTLRTHSFV